VMESLHSYFFSFRSYTDNIMLSLHDALPIGGAPGAGGRAPQGGGADGGHVPPRGLGGPGGAAQARPAHDRPPGAGAEAAVRRARSEEHTSELQSREKLVSRLLLEKKKNTVNT